MTQAAVRSKPIRELDRVETVRDLMTDDGQMVSSGSTGTVVHAYSGGVAYEVEFTKPIHAVLTVDQINLRLRHIDN